MKIAKLHESNALLDGHKKRKKNNIGRTSGCTLNPDAGDVEHNVAMFNHMSSPVSGPSVNPCGPMAEDVTTKEISHLFKLHVGDIVEYEGQKFTVDAISNDPDHTELVPSMLKLGDRWVPEELVALNFDHKLREDSNSMDSQIELNYKDLEVSVVTRPRRPSSYHFEYDRDEEQTAEETIDYKFAVPRSEIVDFIYENLTENDFAAVDTATEDEVLDFIEENFDALFAKYESMILDNYRDRAREDASRRMNKSVNTGITVERFIRSLGRNLHEAYQTKKIDNNTAAELLRLSKLHEKYARVYDVDHMNKIVEKVKSALMSCADDVLAEDLADRIRKNELDDEGDDTYSAEEGDVKIQFQDRELHTHELRTGVNQYGGKYISGQRNRQPKVASNTWGRVWQGDNLVKQVKAPKYQARAELAKYLDSLQETWDESDSISKAYERYVNYCEEHGKEPCSYNEFMKGYLGSGYLGGTDSSTRRGSSNVTRFKKTSPRGKLAESSGYVTRFHMEYYTNDDDDHRRSMNIYADTYEEAEEELFARVGSDITITAGFPEEVPAEYKQWDMEESHQRGKVRESSKTVNEANYGGAFDIDPEVYFTRDDLVEFAEGVISSLEEEIGIHLDICDVYIDGNNVTLELTDTVGCEFDHTVTFRVDMRKIHVPRDLGRKYTSMVVNNFASEYRNSQSMTESSNAYCSREYAVINTGYSWRVKDGSGKWVGGEFATDSEAQDYIDSLNESFYDFEDDGEESDYELIDRKRVLDSNGFLDEYSWYRDRISGLNVFVFGDSDLYGPDSGNFDHEEEDDSAAQEWFDAYGQDEEDDLYENWKRGAEVTLWWTDPNWSDHAPCFATCTYIGKSADGRLKCRSTTYGDDYLLDVNKMTVTTPSGKTFKVDNSSGWLKNVSSLKEDYNVQFYKILQAPTKPTENGKLVGQRGDLESALAFGYERCGKGNFLIHAVCDDGKVRDIDLYSYFNESITESLVGKRVRGTNAYGDAVGALGTVISEDPRNKDRYGNYAIEIQCDDGRVEKSRSFWVKVVDDAPENTTYDHWTGPYAEFEKVVSQYEPFETDKIEQAITQLYQLHKGDAHWDNAYRRWLDSSDDMDESFSEEEDNWTLSVYDGDALLKDDFWSVSDALEYIHENGGNIIKRVADGAETVIWKDGKAVGAGFIAIDYGDNDEIIYAGDGETVETHAASNTSSPFEFFYSKPNSLKEWNEFSDDPVEDDQTHASVYGGDSSYCPVCGADKAYDEDGFAYCPECNREEQGLVESTEGNNEKTVGVAFDVTVPTSMTESELETLIRQALGPTSASINSYMEIHTLDESLKESFWLNDPELRAEQDKLIQQLEQDGWQEVNSKEESGRYYTFFRKVANGKGQWKAVVTSSSDHTAAIVDVSYGQARGDEPMSDIGALRRKLGDMLLR